MRKDFPDILRPKSVKTQYSEKELRSFREDNQKGVEIDEKQYTMYEATQKQRAIERAMRAQKKKILVAEATGDPNLPQLQSRMQVLSQEYSRFSDRTGLRTQVERTAVYYNHQSGSIPPKPYKPEDIKTEFIHKSVGAKSRNYNVFNPSTGEYIHLTEGTWITQPKNHVMAGHGRERQIDCIDWLLDKYGGDRIEWTKEKGFGYVDDEYGETHKVELHWYQEPSIGKVEMKIKIREGAVYLDD